MSFSFSFSGEDIDDQDGYESTTTDIAAKLDNTNINSSQTSISPKRHTLTELLESLPDQISYNWHDVPASQIQPGDGGTQAAGHGARIPRRALFDVRQQLMFESDPTAHHRKGDQITAESLLEGLQTGDLSTGVYEGGFKTWECAVDLAGYVSCTFGDVGIVGDVHRHIIELGAGSAIPCLALLQKVLRYRQSRCDDRCQWSKVRFTLCDYNEDVLRLCTAVNVFLTTVLSSQGETEQGTLVEEEDLEIKPDLVRKTLQTLVDTNIQVDFISGGWGDEFTNLLHSNHTNGELDTTTNHTLLLASETIYSPASLEIFSQMVLELLTPHDNGDSQRTRALIAAKKVYFGVGGGVAEFEDTIRSHNGRLETVLDVKGAGVGRVILEVFTS